MVVVDVAIVIVIVMGEVIDDQVKWIVKIQNYQNKPKEVGWFVEAMPNSLRIEMKFKFAAPPLSKLHGVAKQTLID